jgi:hypothetical protein
LVCSKLDLGLVYRDESYGSTNKVVERGVATKCYIRQSEAANGTEDAKIRYPSMLGLTRRSFWENLKVFKHRFALPLARTNDDGNHSQLHFLVAFQQFRLFLLLKPGAR